jgi:hypothetical protein
MTHWDRTLYAHKAQDDTAHRADGWRRVADTARRLAEKHPTDADHWQREARQADRHADMLEGA